MRVQQAAYDILREKGEPMRSRELAETMLKRGLISSNAKDPVFSLSTTIDKNVREGKYNDPKLILISTERGRRLLGLPAWKKNTSLDRELGRSELKVNISSNLMKKLELALQAELAPSFDETVVLLLNKGLMALSREIKTGLASLPDKFDEL